MNTYYTYEEAVHALDRLLAFARAGTATMTGLDVSGVDRDLQVAARFCTELKRCLDAARCPSVVAIDLDRMEFRATYTPDWVPPEPGQSVKAPQA